MGLGGAMVIVALVLMTVRRLAGDCVVDALADGPGNRPVTANAWLGGTSLMRDVAVSVLAYGLLVIAAAWLVLLAWGPGAGDRRLLRVVVLTALFLLAVAAL